MKKQVIAFAMCCSFAAALLSPLTPSTASAVDKAAGLGNPIGVAFGGLGILSGNVIQVPVTVPVNVCGNSINVASVLSPTFGNSCANS